MLKYLVVWLKGNAVTMTDDYSKVDMERRFPDDYIIIDTENNKVLCDSNIEIPIKRIP